MQRQSLRRSLLFAAVAGLAAAPLASSASPERGKPASANCGPDVKIDPIRAALFARCVMGSDEIGNRAGRGIGDAHARAAATATDRGCRAGTRTTTRHAVCYAAILPSSRGDTATDE